MRGYDTKRPNSVTWRAGNENVSLYGCIFPLDSHPGGLERGFVQRHGSHVADRSSLLRSPHDLWKLCPFQPTGGHLGWRLSGRGKGTRCFSFKQFDGSLFPAVPHFNLVVDDWGEQASFFDHIHYYILITTSFKNNVSFKNNERFNLRR